MRRLKTVPALAACGIAVSALVTALIDPLWIPTWVQKFVNWVLPGDPTGQTFGLVADALVGAIIATPGVLVATALILYVRERNPGETRCRRCGQVLKRLAKPRCPECGEVI